MRLVSPPHGGADRNRACAAGQETAAVAPSRGRGSKLHRGLGPAAHAASPPHGGADRNAEAASTLRAAEKSPPHGGADRNSACASGRTAISCRPLTGARIDTAATTWTSGPSRSPPHGGADRNAPALSCLVVSRVAPSRGRGSKRARMALRAPPPGSPPHGGADRNDNLTPPAPAPARRPLTGARIETHVATPARMVSMVATSGGADRNDPYNAADLKQRLSPPSRGRGSKQVAQPLGPGKCIVAPSPGRGSKLTGQVHGTLRQHGDLAFVHRWRLLPRLQRIFSQSRDVSMSMPEELQSASFTLICRRSGARFSEHLCATGRRRVLRGMNGFPTCAPYGTAGRPVDPVKGAGRTSWEDAAQSSFCRRYEVR